MPSSGFLFFYLSHVTFKKEGRGGGLWQRMQLIKGKHTQFPVKIKWSLAKLLIHNEGTDATDRTHLKSNDENIKKKQKKKDIYSIEIMLHIPPKQEQTLLPLPSLD